MPGTLVQIQESIPDGPVADLLKQKRRLERTRARRGYNYPKRYFVRVDGDVVSLPGDPDSVVLYKDKGYQDLTPVQAEDWEKNVRPLYLKELKKRSTLIQTIERMKKMYPDVRIDAEYERATTAQIEELLTSLESVKGKVEIFRIELDEEEEPDPIAEAVKDAIQGDGSELEMALKRSQAAGHRRLM